MWKLIDCKTKAEVKNGDTVVTFRGDEGVLEGWSAPHKPSSTGRIHVRFKSDGQSYTQEFYPTVCNLKIVEDKGYADIKVGDVVKSYDFPDKKDCYIIGQVVHIGPVDGLEPDLDRYHIRLIGRVWGAEVALEGGDYCYPPVNGSPTLMGQITKGVVPFWG